MKKSDIPATHPSPLCFSYLLSSAELHKMLQLHSFSLLAPMQAVCSRNAVVYMQRFTLHPLYRSCHLITTWLHTSPSLCTNRVHSSHCLLHHSRWAFHIQLHLLYEQQKHVWSGSGPTGADEFFMPKILPRTNEVDSGAYLDEIVADFILFSLTVTL